jgi:hypothetical protein
MSNPARRGPQKVWSGYRNLRVPNELFEDVRNYLNQRKNEYFKDTEGYVQSMSSSLNDDQIRNIIREELQGMGGHRRVQPTKSGSSTSQGRISPPSSSGLTSKDLIKNLLKQTPGQQWNNKQLEIELNLPAATCRQSSRELAVEDPTINIINGRPNKFYYEP